VGPRKAELVHDHKVAPKRAKFEPAGADIAAFSLFGFMGISLGLGLLGG
jgi:hypothetical protein